MTSYWIRIIIKWQQIINIISIVEREYTVLYNILLLLLLLFNTIVSFVHSIKTTDGDTYSIVDLYKSTIVEE